MAVDAIIAVAGDLLFEEAAATVVADIIGEAVVETVVADAVGAVVADGIAAGLTDAALATAVEAAGATAAETALAGFGADAALATGIDAAAIETVGAIAPATEAGYATVADTIANTGILTEGGILEAGVPLTEGASTALEGYDAAMADLAASNAEAAAAAADEAVAGGGAAGGGEVAGAVSPADAAAVSDEAVASGGNLGNGAGGVPVEDAVPSWVNPNPTPDPTLGTALGNYAGAVADSLGTAGLLGAGALGAAALSGALTPPTLSGSVGSGGANYEWGQGTPLVNPGLNPGYIGYAASMPDYQSTNPTDAQYYWGVHAPVNTAADLATYNQLPAGAPATPWGAGMGGRGATPGFNPADFVNQYIMNPAWAGVNSATAPGYTAPGPAVPVIQ